MYSKTTNFYLICTFFLLNILLFGSSCKKESIHPNAALVPEIGNWQVKTWTFIDYQNNQVQATSSRDNVGTIQLNNVNYGEVSEGKFLVEYPVFSPTFFLANNNCFETFRWHSDEHCISFILNTCTNDHVTNTYTIDGFGTNEQTWTRIETNTDGSLKTREIFKVSKQ